MSEVNALAAYGIAPSVFSATRTDVLTALDSTS
jgi:hypothetical protein